MKGELSNPRGTDIANSNVSQVIARLERPGSIKFTDLHELLQGEELDDELREVLQGLVMVKIQECMEYGNFGDLRGAEEVLELLKIEGIDFSEEWVRMIEDLYSRFSLHFLTSLSPMLYDGKLADGRPYDKIEYTRERLVSKGAPEEELTDEFIRKLWEVREVLIRLHNTRFDVQKSLEMKNLLELGDHSE